MRAAQRVSCLCVTRQRPEELQRAITAFLHQSYDNKELLVLYETDDRQTIDVLERCAGHSEIVSCAVPVAPKLTLGELRNRAIDACSGDYFCQWDDDDWYHVDRLKKQLEYLELTQQDACMLSNWLMFDASERQAYLSHFRLWEGSLLCRKAALGDARYPALSKMEDSFFVNALIARCRVVPLIAPELYLYVLHEKNTWDRYHRRVMLSSSQRLSSWASQIFADVLSERYSPEEASLQLGSVELRRELDYLRVNTLTPSDEQLRRYRETMERVTRAGAVSASATT